MNFTVTGVTEKRTSFSNPVFRDYFWRKRQNCSHYFFSCRTSFDDCYICKKILIPRSFKRCHSSFDFFHKTIVVFVATCLTPLSFRKASPPVCVNMKISGQTNTSSSNFSPIHRLTWARISLQEAIVNKGPPVFPMRTKTWLKWGPNHKLPQWQLDIALENYSLGWDRKKELREYV